MQTVCKLLQRTTDLNGHLSVTVEDDLPTPDAEVRGCFVTLEAPGEFLRKQPAKKKQERPAGNCRAKARPMCCVPTAAAN